MRFNFERPPERPAEERGLEELRNQLRGLEAEHADLSEKRTRTASDEKRLRELTGIIEDLRRRIRNMEKDLERPASGDEKVQRRVESEDRFHDGRK